MLLYYTWHNHKNGAAKWGIGAQESLPFKEGTWEWVLKQPTILVDTGMPGPYSPAHMNAVLSDPRVAPIHEKILEILAKYEKSGMAALDRRWR